MSDTHEQAYDNAKKLQDILTLQHGGEPLLVRLAYSEQHIGGVGDLAQAMSQALFAPLSNYNLNTMVRQMASETTTRKLLLVGHSQGALYANSIYEYVTTHGEPARSVDIYAIATPGSYVAGGGSYGTSYDDAVIMSSRLVAHVFSAPEPLPSNLIVRGGKTFTDPVNTHKFSTYLEGAGEEIVYVIGQELDALKAETPLAASGCFAAPDVTFFETIQKIAFGFVDPVANETQAKVILGYRGAVVAVSGAAGLAQLGAGAIVALTSSLGKFFSNPEINPAMPENYEKNFQIMKSLYGSSLNKEDYEELNGTQGGAVALAKTATKKPKAPVATPKTTAPVSTTSPVVQAPLQPPEQKKIPAVSTRPAEVVAAGGSSLPNVPEVIARHDESSGGNPPAPPSDTVEASTTPPVSPTPPSSPPPSSHMKSPISDTFDGFNSLGWEAISRAFGAHKLFDFDNGSDGSCVRGGCLIGNDPALGYIDISPVMSVQMPEAQESGAYTLYAKATNGFNAPEPLFTVCQTGFNNCNDEGGIVGITFFGVMPVDDTWHHYYFAWRQGASSVERCAMQDNIEPADCVWIGTDIPLGTKFDGVALWSGRGYRNDLGGNLWFDELEAQ